MTKSDKKQFGLIMAMLAENYNRESSDTLARLWWDQFAPHPLEGFEAAVLAHVRAEKFFPTISDIYQRLNATPGTSAAWTKAIEAVSSVGSYNDVVFDDPVIHVTIRRMGGWTQFCGLEHTTWDQKEFDRKYEEAAAEIEAPGCVLGHLIPEVELKGRIDRAPSEARLIGDREKLRAWAKLARADQVEGAKVTKMIEGVGDDR